MNDCIFCDIAEGKARASVVLETDTHIAFENIDPQAPVHVIVIPKKHVEKENAISCKVDNFWKDLMQFTYQVIKKYELEKTGYRLVNNGAGYQDIDHEHLHLLGGQGFKPQDNL